MYNFTLDDRPKIANKCYVVGNTEHMSIVHLRETEIKLPLADEIFFGSWCQLAA
jgi:hypothetical protein